MLILFKNQESVIGDLLQLMCFLFVKQLMLLIGMYKLLYTLRSILTSIILNMNN